MTGKNEISTQLERWKIAVETHDPDAVLALYAAEAVLLPTLSPKVSHTGDEIRDYFVHFLAKKPSCEPGEQNIRIYGDIAVNSGLYSFLLMEEGVESLVTARYTFVYKRFGDSWLIVEHHSSLSPG
jgi:uncharacterized protein (TIGR02246 family)